MLARDPDCQAEEGGKALWNLEHLQPLLAAAAQVEVRRCRRLQGELPEYNEEALADKALGIDRCAPQPAVQPAGEPPHRPELQLPCLSAAVSGDLGRG